MRTILLHAEHFRPLDALNVCSAAIKLRHVLRHIAWYLFVANKEAHDGADNEGVGRDIAANLHRYLYRFSVAIVLFGFEILVQ